jgi:hypothetical protein
MILRLCHFQILQVPDEMSIFKNFTNSHYTVPSRGNVSLKCLPTENLVQVSFDHTTVKVSVYIKQN